MLSWHVPLVMCLWGSFTMLSRSGTLWTATDTISYGWRRQRGKAFKRSSCAFRPKGGHSACRGERASGSYLHVKQISVDVLHQLLHCFLQAPEQLLFLVERFVLHLRVIRDKERVSHSYTSLRHSPVRYVHTAHRPCQHCPLAQGSRSALVLTHEPPADQTARFCFHNTGKERETAALT